MIPTYANTHSTTGHNARQTGKYREEARCVFLYSDITRFQKYIQYNSNDLEHAIVFRTAIYWIIIGSRNLMTIRIQRENTC